MRTEVLAFGLATGLMASTLSGCGEGDPNRDVLVSIPAYLEYAPSEYAIDVPGILPEQLSPNVEAIIKANVVQLVTSAQKPGKDDGQMPGTGIRIDNDTVLTAGHAVTGDLLTQGHPEPYCDTTLIYGATAKPKENLLPGASANGTDLRGVVTQTEDWGTATIDPENLPLFEAALPVTIPESLSYNVARADPVLIAGHGENADGSEHSPSANGSPYPSQVITEARMVGGIALRMRNGKLLILTGLKDYSHTPDPNAVNRPGDSGGPVFNLRTGELLGVLASGYLPDAAGNSPITLDEVKRQAGTTFTGLPDGYEPFLSYAQPIDATMVKNAGSTLPPAPCTKIVEE